MRVPACREAARWDGRTHPPTGVPQCGLRPRRSLTSCWEGPRSQVLSIGVQTERVTRGVEQHADMCLRLMVSDRGAE